MTVPKPKPDQPPAHVYTSQRTCHGVSNSASQGLREHSFCYREACLFLPLLLLLAPHLREKSRCHQDPGPTGAREPQSSHLILPMALMKKIRHSCEQGAKPRSGVLRHRSQRLASPDTRSPALWPWAGSSPRRKAWGLGGLSSPRCLGVGQAAWLPLPWPRSSGQPGTRQGGGQPSRGAQLR